MTNFDSKQSDYPEGWLLNLIIALFLCRGRSICRVMETRLKHGYVKWQTISNAASGLELVDAMETHLEKDMTFNSIHKREILEGSNIFQKFYTPHKSQLDPLSTQFLVSIKPITTTTMTNFDSKQSDYPEGWLLNLIITLFLCCGRSICRVMETRLKHGYVKWQTISNAGSGLELVDVMETHLEKDMTFNSIHKREILEGSNIFQKFVLPPPLKVNWTPCQCSF